LMIASPDWITEENALRTTNQDRAGARPCPSSGAAENQRPTAVETGPNTTLVAGPRACTWQPASTPSQRFAMKADRSQSAALGLCQEQ